jgi:RNA-directed DNA polymerase
LQTLLNLVLEPLVEANSDTHSYGFRKYKSAKNALGYLRTHIKSGGPDKFILDADIKGFFENIDHT